MSVLFARRTFDNGSGYPSPTAGSRVTRFIGRRGAMRHSAAWASTRLRADLISTLPADVFTRSGGVQIEVEKPPVIVNPGGELVSRTEWMYSSQVDLDTCGNTFGLITSIDGAGRPARIDLLVRDDVTVQVRNGVISYRVGAEEFPAKQIWHEKQFTSSGLAVGLSPIAYAAMSLYQHQSAQEFATRWFSGNAIPTGNLKYGSAAVPPKEADAIKARFRLAIENGDVFVHGKDWDYNVIQAQGSQASFLETQKLTDIDVARFFGVPGDLIDVVTGGSSITYANVVQRNLQFLVMHLGPAIVRREEALTTLLAPGRFVKLNTDALLRMDPETLSKVLGQEVKDRLIAPSEARELRNREPFTQSQLDEFKALFPNLYSNGGGSGSAATGADAKQIAEIIQKIYLGVGKVVTVEEAREIVNSAGGNLTGTFNPTS